MIEITCPKCSKVLRLPDGWVGDRGRCPRCQNVLHIPGATAQIPAEFSLPPPPEMPPGPPPAIPPARARKRLPGPLLLGAGIAVGAVALALGLLAMQAWRGGGEQAAAPPAPGNPTPQATQPVAVAPPAAPVVPRTPSPPPPPPTIASPAVSPPAPLAVRSPGAPAVAPPPEAAKTPAVADSREPSSTDRTGGFDMQMTGASRRYDDLECRQIQARHGIRIPAAATILEIDGQRLAVLHPGTLAASSAPILALPPGSHAVCFRPSEQPLAAVIEGDLLDQYEAMRKYFGVGGKTRSSELMNRAAKTMDVHSAPFLLNFSGAEYALAGKWEVAERKFRRALLVNPTLSPAHLNLAECLAHRKAMEDAGRELALAEIFNVGNVFGLTHAIAETRRRLKLPRREEPIDLAAFSYAASEIPSEEDLRLTALLDGLSKYAVQDTQRAKLLNNLAVHFAESGRPELALHHFHRALEVVLHAGEGRFELARQVFANIKRVCRTSGFPEADEYEQMENMVLQ